MAKGVHQTKIRTLLQCEGVPRDCWSHADDARSLFANPPPLQRRVLTRTPAPQGMAAVKDTSQPARLWGSTIIKNQDSR